MVLFLQVVTLIKMPLAQKRHHGFFLGWISS